MTANPGTPSLMRELNVRTALSLLVEQGPMTRAELGHASGLSKVTASQLIASLVDQGLVAVVGARPGSRGPVADLYGVVPTAAFAVGVDVGPAHLTASVVDVLGRERERVVRPADGDDPVTAVHDVVRDAVRAGRASLARVRSVVIGAPGLVDPRSGEVDFSYDLPAWHAGLRDSLRRDLRSPVTIENDVNLAAVAEQREGAAQQHEDFALLWVSRGIGSAIVLSGRVHRGASGAAGELGYLPVPGVDLPEQISRRDKGAFQRLVGQDAVLELARAHGIAVSSSEDAVRTATADGRTAFLDELAGRLAVGVAAVCAVVDPGLVVMTGPLASAGGEGLCERIAAATSRIAPVHPRVIPTGVADHPVLRGALLTALDHTRRQLTD